MTKVEVGNTIRAHEAEILFRRKIQAGIVALFLVGLSVFTHQGLNERVWLVAGVMLVALVGIDFWFQLNRKHKVICNSCKLDLVLGLRTNYELLENKCSSCGGEIYET